MTDPSSGFKVRLPLILFKTKCPSLLIRFTMTPDGKYKTSYVDVFAMSIKNVFDSTPTYSAVHGLSSNVVSY